MKNTFVESRKFLSSNTCGVSTKPTSTILFDPSDNFISNNISDLAAFSIIDLCNIHKDAFSDPNTKKMKLRILRANGYGISQYYVLPASDFYVEGSADGMSKQYEHIVHMIRSLLDSLDKNTVYKCLFLGATDFGEHSCVYSAVYISCFTKPEFLFNILKSYSRVLEARYIGDKEFISWQAALKKWRTRCMVGSKFEEVLRSLDGLNNKKLVRLLAGYNAYVEYISPHRIIAKTGVRKFDTISISSYETLLHGCAESARYRHGSYDLTIVKDCKRFSVTVFENNVQLSRWSDEWTSTGQIWRRDFMQMGLKVYYKGSDYQYFELLYRTEVWKPNPAEIEYDEKIGSLDVETYRCRDAEYLGLCIPYACGFRDFKGRYSLFYLEKGEDAINLVVRMLESLVIRRYDGFKFYVHNLAGFDSRFILAALGRMLECDVVPLGRSMNEIFQIKISRLAGKKKISITLSDSMYIVPQSLELLGLKFRGGSENMKGYFPHDVVAENNIFYKGNMPDYKFYRSYYTLDEYSALASVYNREGSWCLKSECLAYLKKDLDCLHYVMNTFNRSIYDMFLVNTTKVSSYSGLSKRVYLTEYYSKIKPRIPVISGHIENIIRAAYFGGVVDVPVHVITNGFKYDSNSHYPAAMLNDMPTGTPRVSDIKDLDKIFGFVYARITAPTVGELEQAILPCKDDEGNIHCPRGEFCGVYFSEELKDVVKYGYKVEVIASILFDRGQDLFKDFVNNLYALKAEAKEEGDMVMELIYKLILNSLYGKTGQLEILYNFKFMPIVEFKDYELRHDVDLTQTFGEKILVRDHGVIESDLKDLITNQSEDGCVKVRTIPRKKGGVKSSVAIAAAITSYARIAINKYKNIPGNKYLGGDTDSAILQYPLDSKFVGKGLGQMKLEQEVELGLFADKKLYYIRDKDGKIIIKSRGVGRDYDASDILNYEHFIKLLAGHELTVNKRKFMIENDGVYIKDGDIRVSIKEEVYEGVKAEVDEIIKTEPASLKYGVAKEIISMRL